ncbi:phage integrase central domain-containing protein [Sphingomonas albertensis]|uniref:tyrosine-type recombinase/integrase n=1 Tax=Sphingomonas albertensis TaxID=2762591 RepID=UPI002E2D9392|nr:integrase arm-type DNA-binding domain-containing protein [Sphingomonas albertensis]
MLTELRCRQARAAEKSYKLSDGRGLHLFVTTTGFRSWRWKYRIAGKEKLLVLGSYPDVSLALAREHRDAASRLLKAGTDPSVDRKQAAAVRHIEHATTFEAVAREWHAQQLSSWVAVHAADVLNSLEKDVFPYIGSTPVAAVTSPMVLQLVRRIEERPSVETARRVRQRISAVYGFAIASGYATSDPAVSIRGAMKPLIKKRQPALGSLEEARALLMAAEASAAHPMTKLASRLLALTALRPGTLRTTGWPSWSP